MDAATWVALIALVGAALSALYSYQVNRKLRRYDAILEADRTLRDRRFGAYTDLWNLTGRLRFRPTAYPAAADLQYLSRALIDWYYDTGGLLVTDQSRDAILALRRQLDHEVARIRVGDRLDPGAYPGRYRLLFEAGSQVRTNLTADVVSRVEARIAEEDERRPGPWRDVSGRLSELAELLDLGLISEDDYRREKARTMGE